MLSAGFASAPLTRLLVVYIVAASILASATDNKHYFYIHVYSHLWRYRQFWRIFAWQACFLNSTEVLFAAITIYNIRVIERLWGTRKLASFLLVTSIYNAILPPAALALILRPLSGNTFNYLPAGPTPLIFALLAQYHAAVPYIYRYRVTGSSNASADDPNGIILTSKSLYYVLPLQLALSQLPGSILSAAVGWIVGYAWRADLLPFPSNRWRIPNWLYGGRAAAQGRGRVDELRRRMEGEAASASGTNRRELTEHAGARRRPLGSAILDRFRGAF